MWRPFELGLRPRPLHAMVVIMIEVFMMALVGPSLPDAKKEFFGSLSKASLYGGFFDAGGAFIGFALTPLYGRMSDKRGRAPLVCLTSCLGALPYLALAAAATFDVTLWAFFASKVVAGATSLGLAFAYLSDVTSEESRTRWFGYALVVVFIPVSLGPLLALAIGRRWAWRMAGIFGVLGILYSWLVLPESLGWKGRDGAARPPDTSMPHVAGGDAAVSGALGEPLAPTRTATGASASGDDSCEGCEGAEGDDDLLAPLPLRRSESINPFVPILYIFRTDEFRAVAIITFFFSFVENGIIEALLLYLQQVLDYSDRDNSAVLFTAGLSAGLTLGLLMPRLLRRYGERAVIIIGITVQLVRVALYAGVFQKWQPIALEAFTGLSFMPFPSVSGSVSKRCPPEQQGMTQGGLAGIRAFCTGAGPLFFSGMLALFTSKNRPVYLPQAPFLFAVPLLAVALWQAVYRVPKTLGEIGGPPLTSKARGSSESFTGGSDDDQDDRASVSRRPLLDEP